MFERRLKWLAIMLGLLALAILVRLGDIQVLRASEYRALATRLLTRPVRYLPAPRGRILDRHGRPLVTDQPAFDICVHYGVLAGRRHALFGIARALRDHGEFPASMNLEDIVATLHHDIADIWQRLSDLTGQPVAEFIERGQRIQASVDRIRAAVANRTGVVQPVAEESELHPIIEGASDELALAVRLELEKYPWFKRPLLRVVPGSRRVAQQAEGLEHVLGRLGAVTPEHLAQDPLRDDELRRLRPNERCGVSGVEWLAETTLRGTRGRIVEDFDRREIEHVAPQPGRDICLTIAADWQSRVHGLLAAAVEQSEYRAGGAAIVIDVATREIRVLASYPGYDYDSFDEQYEALRQDTQRLPLVSRALTAQYPPGSTCKAITLVGGLSAGVIDEDERIHCTGYLLAEQPTAFRCWIYNQYLTTHDAGDPAGQNAELAVRNSCNIYFYRVGERLGPGRLCEWFSRFGLGRPAGTGLLEERPGVVPTAAWLARRQAREYQPADAWNFAIGQGEVTITPLQAANVAASVAAGRWEPVHLARDSSDHYVGPPPEPAYEFDPRALHVLRAGMWRVVNDGGTAKDARLDDRDHELCGKTGSAQTQPRVLTRRYVCEWPDGRREEVIAPSKQDALAMFSAPQPQIVGWSAAERYPELGDSDKLPAHAWFIGYTQPASTRRGEAPQGPVYAISVLIEFGGSGGHVAGPLAKQIAEMLLEAREPAP